MQAVVNEHDALSMALILAIHIAALCLDIVCCYLPPKEPAGSGVKGINSLLVCLISEQPLLLPYPVASPGHACPQEGCVMQATTTSWLTSQLERMVSYIAPLHFWLSCMQLHLAVIEEIQTSVIIILNVQLTWTKLPARWRHPTSGCPGSSCSRLHWASPGNPPCTALDLPPQSPL